MSVSKNLRHIGLISALVVAMSIPAMTFISYPVAATDYTYSTMYASAYNSSYYGYYIDWGWPPESYYDPDPPEPMYEVQVHNDTYYQDLYEYRAALVLTVKTNGFTNPTHYNPLATIPTLGGTHVSELPPNNGTATILSVCISFTFMTSISPSGTLKYSIDDESSWESLSVPQLSGWYHWNVTSKESWTVGMLWSDELWVRYDITADPDRHYYMDYLGISVKWSVPYAVEGYPPYIPPSEDDPPLPSTDYDSWITADNIPGIMGFVGLIGVVAVPVLAIYAFRQTDEGRMSIGIKMFVAFMVFATMFIASLTL